MSNDKEYFSEVKRSKACKEKNCTSVLEDAARDKTLREDLTIVDFNEDNVRNFIFVKTKAGRASG